MGDGNSSPAVTAMLNDLSGVATAALKQTSSVSRAAANPDRFTVELILRQPGQVLFCFCVWLHPHAHLSNTHTAATDFSGSFFLFVFGWHKSASFLEG